MEIENKNIITKKGLKELKDEYKNLVEIERPKVIQEIKDARSQGDLSENAEFDAARQRQGQIEDRISEIERSIEESKVASSSSKKRNKINVGSIVELKIDSKIKKFTIVGSLEADPMNNKISNLSPLGAALINHEKDETVSYKINTKNIKKTKKVLIINVEN